MNQIKLFLLLFLITFSYSDTILLDKNTEFQEILSKSEIFIDHSRKVTIDDVIGGKVEFEKNDKDNLSFGYSPDLDVWIKFKLKNNTNGILEKIIEYENSITTHVNFYDVENREFIREGSFVSSKKRSTLAPIFKVKLYPFEEKVYYLKASSSITTLIIKINLWNSESFYEKEISNQLILALFFGAMVILGLYNLSIFFFTKETSYLYYVFYLFGIILHQLMYVGMANIYLTSQEIFIFITEYGSSFLVAIPALALGLFTKSFLRVEKYENLNKILNIFLIVTILSSVLFLFTDAVNRFRSLFPFLLLVYLMSITVYAAIKKNRQAYFILSGWVIFLTSGMFMFLSSAGFFNIGDSFKYYVEIGLVLEATIFSIALADRIKQLQKEKNAITNKLLLQEKEEGERLKVLVEDKTKDLKNALDEKNLLLREVHHRVKNNMQLILSLIELQSDDIEDKKLKEIFTTVQSRIYAMSELHELLYREDVNILKIDAYEYFDRIVDELKQSYSMEYIDIKFDIQAKVEIAQAIYCGLILNELVTNSMKYAFRENSGYISISLKHMDGKYIFHIEDNGIGFDGKHKDGSLGLLLVDTLAKNQLRGELNMDTKDGVKVDIMWRENDK